MNLVLISLADYGCRAGVGRGLGDGASLGVGVGLAVDVGVAVAVAVSVGVGDADGVGVGVVPCPQYLPPVSKKSKLPVVPPQAIISLPVHTAVWEKRAAGALAVLVAVQLLVSGSYLPPVPKRFEIALPPQTII
jgi:hypothetical protein